MIKLFIDDTHLPPDYSWILVKSSFDAIRFLKMYGCPDQISFNGRSNSTDIAMNVVDWMVDNYLDGQFDIPRGFRYSTHCPPNTTRPNTAITERLRAFKHNHVILEGGDGE